MVDVGEDLEGIVPESQLPLPPGESAEQVVVVGQGVALKVVEVDPIHHRIIFAATDFLEKPAPADEGEPEPTSPESESPEAEQNEGTSEPSDSPE